jgi:hypothetical protein
MTPAEKYQRDTRIQEVLVRKRTRKARIARALRMRYGNVEVMVDGEWM